MNNSRDCWSCAKRAAGCVGMTGPRDLEPACWVPEQEEAGRVYAIPARENGKTAAMKAALEQAAEQARQIKERLTETRLTPGREELLEGVRIEHKAPTAGKNRGAKAINEKGESEQG